MDLRLAALVIDCHDHAAQARWWATVLGWRIVFESQDEVEVCPPGIDDAPIPPQLWARTPPVLTFVPVPEAKTLKNRLHLDLAPHSADDREAQLRRLLELGATRIDLGQGEDVTWEVLADPEGNEFCLLSSRDR